MSDLSDLQSWANYEGFVAADPRRANPLPVPLGTCLEKIHGSPPQHEEWELFFLPSTLEVVQQRVAEPREVRLVARVRHRDYLDDALAELDYQDERRSERNNRLASRGGTIPIRVYRSHWQRHSGASALIEELQAWEARYANPEHEDPGLPLADWGHTRSHVDDLDKYADIWDEFDEYVESLRADTETLFDDLRGNFNVAEASNLAMDVADGVVLLRSLLVEAYVRAHVCHPGKQV